MLAVNSIAPICLRRFSVVQYSYMYVYVYAPFLNIKRPFHSSTAVIQAICASDIEETCRVNWGQTPFTHDISSIVLHYET